MGSYGDYQPDSDGWDDGFADMLDSGDDSGAYFTTYAETEPDEFSGYAEDPPDWSRYRDPTSDEIEEQRWTADEHDHRRFALLGEWESRWMRLSSDMSERFLRRPEVKSLSRHPRWLAFAAIHREKKLVDALAFAEAVKARVGRDWSQARSYLPMDRKELSMPPECASADESASG